MVRVREKQPDVLLVGNGPSAAKGGLGAAIDQFGGLVVRFNNCVFNDAVGHRIDIWATWGERAFYRDIEQSQTLLTACPSKATKESRDFYDRYKGVIGFSRVSDLDDRGVRKYIGHPSCGALATAHFLRNASYGRVFLWGFDHFSQRRHHYWSTVKDEEHGHDPYRESLWFSNLVEQKRVTRWGPEI